jgi:tetratricopeptide (TPR) repeat protein
MKTTIVFLLFTFVAHILSSQEKTKFLSTSEWESDLSWLVGKIEDIHPNPFLKISKSMFYRDVDSLKSHISGLTDNQIAARMMQLVASIRDGHSNLEPIGLNRWFPIRCYVFRDGLFITAIQSEYKEYVGCKVIRIGNRDPKDALTLCQSLKGSDNQFGELENSVLYLSNADLLQALGIIDNVGKLALQVERLDGKLKSISLASRTIDKQTNWMQWGEMYGPVPDLTTYFGNRVSSDYRKGDKHLPLHLRMRLPYWFDYLDESKTVYFQFNFVSREWNGTAFQKFQRRLFSFIDTSDVRKFVIDIRYNSGGDGSILDPFLHEIIKRDKINQKGKLFVLVGRKTFSAAVMLLGSLKRHTNAYFVGEPAGAPLNHCGDPQSYLLPNSRFVLNLSTLYHQTGGPADKSLYFPIDFPYQFTSHDYFSGVDPALDLVLESQPITVCDMFLQNSHEAMAVFGRAIELTKKYRWYAPFSEQEMNSTGYQLLEQGKVEDAIQAFSLNTKKYPESWKVWDSLAEAYMTEGNSKLAIEYYRKSLELNPGNEAARSNIEKLRLQK